MHRLLQLFEHGHHAVSATVRAHQETMQGIGPSLCEAKLIEREVSDASNTVIFTVIRPTSSLEEVRLELGRCVGFHIHNGLRSSSLVGTRRFLLFGEKCGPYYVPLHRAGREAA